MQIYFDYHYHFEFFRSGNVCLFSYESEPFCLSAAKRLSPADLFEEWSTRNCTGHMQNTKLNKKISDKPSDAFPESAMQPVQECLFSRLVLLILYL